MMNASSNATLADVLVLHDALPAKVQLLQSLDSIGVVAAAVSDEAPEQSDRACVLLLGGESLLADGYAKWRERWPEALIIAVGEHCAEADLHVPENMPTESALKVVKLGCRQALLSRSNKQLQALRQRSDNNLEKMASVAIALSSDRDLHSLLDDILSQGQSLVSCDAASLYLVDRQSDPAQLIFKLTRNDSVEFPFSETRVPIDDASIAGYVTTHDCEVRIDDVYALSADSPYQYNYEFDNKAGYRCVSMIALPMRNFRREVVGVLQFINCKKDPDVRLDDPAKTPDRVRPFDDEGIKMLRALASQSAIAIENNVLLAQINGLFDGFVRASVAAIEQRDPTTSGHSFRVADLCLELAHALPRSNCARFKELQYSDNQLRELRYAALLHDFGKVGVREKVLIKARKLYEWELRELRMRVEITSERLRRQASEKLLAARVSDSWSTALQEQVVDELNQELSRLGGFLHTIMRANEPTVLAEDSLAELGEILAYPYHGIDSGDPGTLISDSELKALSIPRGSLSEEERLEIESHVIHTVNFLKLIPWTPELSDVPRIAGAHHEKLDGSGYPNNTDANEISLQSRIMTVCDIYDALTAADRPYKKAVPRDRAFNILEMEADSHKLDADLVSIFIEAEVDKILEGKDYPVMANTTGPDLAHGPCDFDLHRTPGDA